MKTCNLIHRSLWFFRRSHITVLLGTVLATGILTGALIVGDSVKYSLGKLSLQRIGKIQNILFSGDRLFRGTLAHDLSQKTGWTISAVYQLEGVVRIGEIQANQVQILGVDSIFWQLGEELPLITKLKDDEVFVNRALASKLNLESGDEIVIRIQKKSEMPGNTPFSQNEETAAVRMVIKAVLSPLQMGNFSMEPTQIPPSTVFFSLKTLNTILDLKNKANLLFFSHPNENLSISLCESALRQVWTMEDINLIIQKSKSEGLIIIKSERLFIDPEIEKTISNIQPSATRHTTYFVNELKLNGRSTPYSFVTAFEQHGEIEPLRDDEIIISRWLADDLHTRIGEKLEMTYFVLKSNMRLMEDTTVFKIRNVVSSQMMTTDTVLSPHFPGLSEAQDCREWDPSMPIDLDRIREKDENYWDSYGSTPKARITISRANQLWTTPFGRVTAIQINLSDQTQSQFSSTLMNEIDPAKVGFQFRSAREEAIHASADSTDFGPLFLGLSMFIVIAALILTHLLFSLGIENRSHEIATLLSLGFSSKKIQILFLLEGSIIAGLGSLFGMIFGIVFNQFILYALQTLWKSAVGTTYLSFHVKPFTLAVGCVTGALLAISTLFWTIRGQTIQNIQDIYSDFRSAGAKSVSLNLYIMMICLLIAFILLVINFNKNTIMVFWMSGPLMLIGFFFLWRWVLNTPTKKSLADQWTLNALSFSNIRRKTGKSLAVIILCGLGMFVIIAVGANRKDPAQNALQRSSGTGGFALYGETALPILKDLNQLNHQKTLGLEIKGTDVHFTQIRLKPGSDASCLNLNRVRMPSILGIPHHEMAVKNVFSFVSVLDGFNRDNPWADLNRNLGFNTLPVFVDQGVMLWSLEKQIGDTLQTVNDKGDTLSLILAGSLQNSIFQGSLILSENHFLTHFPSIAGSRILLVETPPERARNVQEQLRDRLQDYGLEIMPASERLAMFLAVENTYVSIFMILGGLGMILGTAGLGILVFRNVIERRSELALLEAVGYTRKSLFRMLLTEHMILFTAGLSSGLLAALIALIPAIVSQGSKIPSGVITGLFGIIFLNGLGWTYWAAFSALKHELIPALRNE